MNPLLSILIPTKDRYITLIPILKGMLSDFNSADVEIVIQDNTDNNDALMLYLNELNNEKIKYFHNSFSMPVTMNCEFAIKNARGKYLIMIGDDDYVLPSIIESVKWMEINKVDCLNSNTATYYWSDILFKYQTKISNPASLIINIPLKRNYTSLNPLGELAKVINSGGVDFANLPRLYHGIVKRTVLDSVFKQCKTYFPGPSPDMANSSALAIFTKSFYIYNAPFSISGKSALSTSGMGVKHTHVGDLDDKPFLDKNLLAQWNKKVPYFWSGDTIYAQSLIHSLNVCNYKAQVNFSYLYAHLLCFEYRNYKIIFNGYSNFFKTKPFSVLIIPFYFIKIFLKRVVFFIKRKTGALVNMKAINDMDTIQKGSQYLIKLHNNS